MEKNENIALSFDLWGKILSCRKCVDRRVPFLILCVLFVQLRSIYHDQHTKHQRLGSVHTMIAYSQESHSNFYIKPNNNYCRTKRSTKRRHSDNDDENENGLMKELSFYYTDDVIHTFIYLLHKKFMKFIETI